MYGERDKRDSVICRESGENRDGVTSMGKGIRGTV